MIIINMGTQGLFGYVLNGKLIMTHVQYDANMLWDILTREIYVIMKHYGSIDKIKTAFSNIQDTRNISLSTAEKLQNMISSGQIDSTEPSPAMIEKCKYFTDLTVSYKSTSDWYCLLRHCQSSFINLLEAGYVLNTENKSGYVFIWNLDTNMVEYTFHYDYDKPMKNIKSDSVMNIVDIVDNMENPPTCSYTEIICGVKEKYYQNITNKKNLSDKINQLEQEIKTIADFQQIKYETCVEKLMETVDILSQLKNYDLQNNKFKLEQINMSSTIFNDRLEALGMIKSS